MKANGGSTQFFEQFDSLRFEAWNTQLAVNTMGSAIKNAILSDIKILEVCYLEIHKELHKHTYAIVECLLEIQC